MKHLQQLFLSEAQSAQSTISEAMRTCLDDIVSGLVCIQAALLDDKAVLICGNGGSAADAQHFSAELLGHYKTVRRPLRAMSITTDTSTLTAIGNDDGYEHVFSRQIAGIGREDDVLVAITTSGRSKNVLAALTAAREQGMKTVVLTGRRGAELKQDADVVIVVPSNDTPRIQEVHGIIIHMWCHALDLAVMGGQL